MLTVWGSQKVILWAYIGVSVYFLGYQERARAEPIGLRHLFVAIGNRCENRCEMDSQPEGAKNMYLGPRGAAMEDSRGTCAPTHGRLFIYTLESLRALRARLILYHSGQWNVRFAHIPLSEYTAPCIRLGSQSDNYWIYTDFESS